MTEMVLLNFFSFSWEVKGVPKSAARFEGKHEQHRVYEFIPENWVWTIKLYSKNKFTFLKEGQTFLGTPLCSKNNTTPKGKSDSALQFLTGHKI